jgi:hypothetical protein
MSYDPLHIDTEPTCGVFSACYDPEGPVGHGESREAAVGALLAIIDSEHESSMLAGSIVALVDALAEANACERDNFRRAEHNLARAEAAERENAALREAVGTAVSDFEALELVPGMRHRFSLTVAMLKRALGQQPPARDCGPGGVIAARLPLETEQSPGGGGLITQCPLCGGDAEDCPCNN